MSKDWYQDIVDFHKQFDHVVGEKPHTPDRDTRRLRIRLLQEEFNEVIEAMLKDDLTELADGIADLIVVALGTAISYGIDIRPVWDEVHRSNMEKVGGGKDQYGKSLKPAGWKPPQIQQLLYQQGMIV